ncbi:MAG TPA: PPC domain-containing DNA-binding protein [Geminicoccus sp.]|uniref:PPC domain-containing DNA-binding protein n=1 Tax=Geminicoccus sp. TaxID=2024832 RepID=UPI002BF4D61B|nr:PPC domain-containing DNA-binding protein [Geminicoccus sp.]HWL67415.1 PPC domain-containing DNA-binding protein [Geminicoccus sp.]
MQARQIHEADGQRTFAVVLDAGDEVMACLEAFAVEHRIAAAQITAIGAFSEATLAFWDGARKEYLEIPVEDATEVVAMLGDVSVMEDGKPKLHLHAVLGRRDASTLGGHLLKGTVEPTLEVVLTESPAHLRRVHDPEKGLPLIRL